jgi:hypothetical protein
VIRWQKDDEKDDEVRRDDDREELDERVVDIKRCQGHPGWLPFRVPHGRGRRR